MLINEQNVSGNLLIQARVTNNLTWNISNSTVSNFTTNTILHQVDLYPDLQFEKGKAKSTYVIYGQEQINDFAKRIGKWFEDKHNKINASYSIQLIAQDILYKGLSKTNSITFTVSNDFTRVSEEATLDNWNNVLIKVSGEIEDQLSGAKVKEIISQNDAMLVQLILPSLIVSATSKQKVEQVTDKQKEETLTYGESPKTREQQVLLNILNR